MTIAINTPKFIIFLFFLIFLTTRIFLVFLFRENDEAVGIGEVDDRVRRVKRFLSFIALSSCTSTEVHVYVHSSHVGNFVHFISHSSFPSTQVLDKQLVTALVVSLVAK